MAVGEDARAGELAARDARIHTRGARPGESFSFGNYYRGIGITVDYGYYKLSGRYKKVGLGGSRERVRVHTRSGSWN